eukprot:gb/GFBE01051596.1/.p1 GENE.gb/GFBE01051596.1/~~gb/GFBE01051596.1/.p1  ORF type:complete len:506 (+),score=59.91 gb/GFBE01051596.1/:1-1518(+)
MACRQAKLTQLWGIVLMQNMISAAAWWHHPTLTALSCDGDAATSQSLVASCRVNAKLHDLVSFMVSEADDPEHWPFLHHTAVVDPRGNGAVAVRLSGLKPGVKYKLSARTHRRGTAIGWRKMWSGGVVHKYLCETKPSAESESRRLSVANAQAAPVFLWPSMASDAKSVWIEVFRHAGSAFSAGNPRLPDYLDQHNAADLAAMFASPTIVPLKPLKTSSITRYCVEVAVAELPGVSTVFVPEYHFGSSMFSDYTSCKNGHCRCMDAVDRGITRQPYQLMEEHCPHLKLAKPKYLCTACNKSQMEVSWKHVGMAPVPIPPHIVPWPPREGYREHSPWPLPNASEKPGHWFAFPVGGMCRPGAQLGEDGCNWRLSNVSHSFSTDRLHKKYHVFDYGFPPPRTADDSRRWARHARAAFASLGAASCGPSAQDDAGDTEIFREYEDSSVDSAVGHVESERLPVAEALLCGVAFAALLVTFAAKRLCSQSVPSEEGSQLILRQDETYLEA